MSDIPTEPSERLAYKLVALYAEAHDAATKRQRDIAEGKLQGALEIAALVVGANTAFALELTLLDSVNRHGQRPAFTTNNRPRKDWHAVLVAEFVANWKIRPAGAEVTG
jgi:hypothetical protein